MILLEENQVEDSALPVAELRRHLRLGTGFGDDTLQDGVLSSFLHAAMSAIEGRLSKALLIRRFVLKVHAWRTDSAQPLPVAPVVRIDTVVMVDASGTAEPLPPDRWRLEQNAVAPVLRATKTVLPSIPARGHVEIHFDAGYGNDFASIPADLRQAVMLLAAHYYEYRDETSLGQGCMPFGVTALIQRYAPIRLGLSS
jgi:uncharacterized phiE125 gp8 family phage protein